MIMAIAVEAGIRDVYTLECMFVLLWITQLAGIIAEYPFSQDDKWFWVWPHMAGWVTFVAAYAPILDSFLLCNAHSERQAPGFVRALVIVEFLLFACFGFVQAYCLTAKAQLPPVGYRGVRDSEQANESSDPGAAYDNIDIDGEGAFIVLSLAAKTSLAWIILTPTLVL
jgi:hypothetical protein